jgi:hypothetical protein
MGKTGAGNFHFPSGQQHFRRDVTLFDQGGNLTLDALDSAAYPPKETP